MPHHINFSSNKKKKGKPQVGQVEDEKLATAIATTAAGIAERPKNDNTDDTSEAGSLDIGACCLCHCSLDYSDKAAFDENDRWEDYDDDGEEDDDSSYYFRKTDPYLPFALEGPHNALLYCDSCPRLFHQQCHFIPVLSFSPSKPWNCLICQVQQQHQLQSKKKHKKHKPDRKQSKKQPEDDMATYPYEIMFQSPPNSDAASWETHWEHDPVVIFSKAVELQKELTTFSKSLQSPVNAHQRAITALETLTSSSRNREHFAKNSQELQQLVYVIATKRQKIHQLFLKLERVRATAEQRKNWDLLQQWLKAHCASLQQREFIERALFPFGTQHPRRWFPITPEYKHSIEVEKQNDKTDPQRQIPTEVTVPYESDKNIGHTGKRQRKTTLETPAAAEKHKREKNENAMAGKDSSGNSDDGFSIDKLACCVCLQGHSSDDNDMILCDGQGCYRAYHAQCIHPHVQIDEDDLDHDWFCPLCQCMCDTLLAVQTRVSGGDDWEQRRMEVAHMRHSGFDVDESSTLKSWAAAGDVFPNAVGDLETAQQLKQGVSNAATTALLAKVIGDIDDVDSDDENAETANGEEDDDNVEEDGHFDLDSYDEERRLEKEHTKKESEISDDESESTHSSQATLVDMSSVELEIGKDELEALTDIDSNDDDDDRKAYSFNRKNGVRRRLSQRNQRTRSECKGDKYNNLDNGKLDLSNIVLGKRKRKPVNYVKLNDALFGEISEQELAKIDDANDDFILSSAWSRLRKRQYSSSSCSGSAEDRQSDMSGDEGSDSICSSNGDHSDADASSTKKTRKLRSKHAAAVSTSKHNGSNGRKNAAIVTKKKTHSTCQASCAATTPHTRGASPAAKKARTTKGKAPAGRRQSSSNAKSGTTRNDTGSASRARAKAARRSFQEDAAATKTKNTLVVSKSRPSSPPNGRTSNSSPAILRSKRNGRSKK